MKVVYVLLESQYQSTISAAANAINSSKEGDLSVELSGYLLEELRDDKNLEDLKRDLSEANVFIGSLIFVQDLAERVVEAVMPNRERLDACIVLPFMPEVMKLNKTGSFSMSQLGKSQSSIAKFMRRKREEAGASFEESMLKLLRNLPKVLKYLPTNKAQDAHYSMLSFQYWLGESATNIENLFADDLREVR